MFYAYNLEIGNYLKLHEKIAHDPFTDKLSG